MRRSMIRIPELVRIKPGALDRMGIYLSRAGHTSVGVMSSEGLGPHIGQRLQRSLEAHEVALLETFEISEPSFEQASYLLSRLPFGAHAVVGIGGGKALDTAKYVATLANLPYYAVPTSLSNDGFCSPQSVLLIQGRRRSLAANLPWAVVIDTEVCRKAPLNLWCSGVGDLVAKLTAVQDWKIAFHARGTPVDDFAALLSDATVFQFAGRPERDTEGVRLLGTALMLNGISMEIAGSSRPASGSEHLISHALDRVSLHPRLHGLQVGCAAYLVSHLQGKQAEFIGDLLERVGFWQVVRLDPFLLQEWRQAVALAPSMKDDYYTVLSERDAWPEIERLIQNDSHLAQCFVGGAAAGA
jgi:glycerol-1-phosphate dehydrogenase [NAD(P)+]